MKRMMTGREAAERDADKAEAAQMKAEKEKEAAIDDEMLAGVASEKEDNSDDDSNHSSVREVVFSTPISPSRGTMLPPVRPTTPEAEVTRKRSFTLVHRTPEKPREAPVAPTTPSNTIARETSPVAATPPAPAEIPASTAPVRLDGRERRAGKNAAYLEAIAIERGRGRGRGRGRQA
jgi:hypothetical protein